MKLYTYHGAPNPRRVSLYLAEKGLEIPTESIDLRAGEQFSERYSAINPCLTVPALALDDGSIIGDSMAICRYLEAENPEPPLFGGTPKQQAMVEWWCRRCDFEGMMAVAEAMRNQADAFKDRALPGPYRIEQIPELTRRGRDRVHQFLDMLEERLGDTDYLAGDEFTMADISALVTVDFAGWIKITPGAQRPALGIWHRRISSRPALAA
jgi:glutathione S-transferase